MKPRNDKEREITMLSEMMPEGLANDKSREYAIDRCFDHDGVICKGVVRCMCCGAAFESDGNKTQQCPHCGRVIETRKSRLQRNTIKSYYCEMHECSDYQVIRTFLVSRIFERDSETKYLFREVIRDWYDNKGRRTIIARPRGGINYYCDLWLFDKPMSIKRDKDRYAYNICPMATYTHSITPILRRNGFDGDTHDVSPRKIIEGLLTNTMFETMWKAGQYDLADSRICEITEYWQQIKIAIRHNYAVADAGIWFDYLRMAEDIGRDIHNPQLVCPIDLQQAHDIVMNIKERKDEKIRMKNERERLIRMAREAKEDAEKFAKAKGIYFGITFGCDNIVVTVLDNIDAYIEEGSKMHHCVFENRYYNKTDSLILSAKNNDGDRLATIELSLDEWKVLQCRGKYNSRPERYDEIVNLVNKNVWQFQHAKPLTMAS